jgi:hypothetical protein
MDDRAAPRRVAIAVYPLTALRRQMLTIARARAAE